MATILAGRFETIAPAERVARALLRAGFTQEDLSIFHVNAPGQHHILALGGDGDAGPEAQPAQMTSLLRAGVAALVLGALGLLIGQQVVPKWGWLVGVLSASVGAYLGSFLGTFAGRSWKAQRDRAHGPAADSAYAPRKAGIVLAIHVWDLGLGREAEHLLRAYGAKDIELTDGRWNRGWVDFDPVREPNRIDEATAEHANTLSRIGR